MNEINPTTLLMLSYGDLEKIVDRIITGVHCSTLAERAAEREMPTLSRKQTAQRLNVSLTTLAKWEKRGYLEPVRIGAKVLYRESDILTLLNRRK